MDKKALIRIDGQQYAIELGSHNPTKLVQLAGQSSEDTSLILADGMNVLTLTSRLMLHLVIYLQPERGRSPHTFQ